MVFCVILLSKSGAAEIYVRPYDNFINVSSQLNYCILLRKKKTETETDLNHIKELFIDTVFNTAQDILIGFTTPCIHFVVILYYEICLGISSLQSYQ
ncbi:hypothetical protein RCL_jg25339.t1 [Rhizophagus clarus]|uniref:Uncharacterized protein n=1 Tax=Rhizophagus clarus TaxID=94130 RepID=A0A8H3QJZ2_9GLOM|nr:hypothetical protein RCL_jg25339.t1 [Rhizophagus clarus]